MLEKNKIYRVTKNQVLKHCKELPTKNTSQLVIRSKINPLGNWEFFKIGNTFYVKLI